MADRVQPVCIEGDIEIFPIIYKTKVSTTMCRWKSGVRPRKVLVTPALTGH